MSKKFNGIYTNLDIEHMAEVLRQHYKGITNKQYILASIKMHKQYKLITIKEYEQLYKEFLEV